MAAVLGGLVLITAAPALGAEPAGGPEVARTLLAAGRKAAERGAYAEAHHALSGALAACRAEGDDRCLWTALTSLGAVDQVLGRLDGAEDFLQEAVSVAHSMGDRMAQGESELALAQVLAERGQAGPAREAARRALAVGGELESVDVSVRALVVLGELDLVEGKTDEAFVAFRESLAGAQGPNATPIRMRARVGLGRCLVARGEYEKAESTFRDTFVEALRLGDKLSVARLLQAMGRLEAARGHPRRAETLLKDALRKYRSLEAAAYARRAALDLEHLRADASIPDEDERTAQAAEATRLGSERLEAGDVEEAVGQLKQAVKLAPYDPAPRLVLARAYRSMGLVEMAEKEDRYAAGLSENNSPFDLTTNNPLYIDYFTRARRQIDRVYVVPQKVAQGGLSGSVRVTFTVGRTGRLVGASVATSGSSPTLDEAALTTLRLAEPFEPLPEGWPWNG